MTLRHYKYSLFFVAPNGYYRVLLQVKKKKQAAAEVAAKIPGFSVFAKRPKLLTGFDGLLTGFVGAFDGLILLLPVCLSS